MEQRSARLPVTEKVAGSNPVSPAKSMKSLLNLLSFLVGLYLAYLAIAVDAHIIFRLVSGILGAILIIDFVRWAARKD